MSQLPAGVPTNGREAFARISAVAKPSLDDLKLMVFLEASGQSGYLALAARAPNPEIRALLEANGREEMAHAHRVTKVIKALSGEDFPPPADDGNPFVAASDRAPDRRQLEMLVAAEDGGGALYDTWAENIDHPEAARLLRLNADEERRHGVRAQEALALLPD